MIDLDYYYSQKIKNQKIFSVEKKTFKARRDKKNLFSFSSACAFFNDYYFDGGLFILWREVGCALSLFCLTGHPFEGCKKCQAPGVDEPCSLTTGI